VIGLLVLGLDVEYDIKPLLYPAGFTRPGGAKAGYDVERLMKVVADHRGRWAWHPTAGPCWIRTARSSATRTRTSTSCASTG
jgi:hypothetical protein